jgi:hypothetical protein
LTFVKSKRSLRELVRRTIEAMPLPRWIAALEVFFTPVCGSDRHRIDWKGRSRMAKGKRSTALFDVMHAARKPVSDPPGGFAIPKWWGKRATKTEPIAPPPPAAVAAPVSPAPELPIIQERSDSPEIQPLMRIVAEAPAEDEPVRVDPIEREVRFKLSYGGAAAAAFVLLLILAITYLAGTRSQPVEINNPTKPGSTASADSATNNSGLLAAVTPDPSPAAPVPVSLPSSPAVVAPQISVAAATSNGARQVGRHYVIAQSYPDQENADRAANALNKAGIVCTVVKGLLNWASPNWYSVVGVKPFDHIQGNDELVAYKKSMEAVSEQFAGKNLFNRFDPREYKWREQPDQTEDAQ